MQSPFQSRSIRYSVVRRYRAADLTSPSIELTSLPFPLSERDVREYRTISPRVLIDSEQVLMKPPVLQYDPYQWYVPESQYWFVPVFKLEQKYMETCLILW